MQKWLKSPDEDPQSFQTAQSEVHAWVTYIRKSEPQYADAPAADIMSELFKRKPGLYRRYRQEGGGSVNLTAPVPPAGQRSLAGELIIRARGDAFLELVAAKEATGLSTIDAMAAAAQSDPEAYRRYVEMVTLRRDGSMVGR